MNPQRSVSASRLIRVPAPAIFSLLADARQHVRFDGSNTLQGVKSAPPRLYQGATFTMNMKIGLAYRTRNVVVVFEENVAIAWHHGAGYVWRYDLLESDAGTKVTASFDYDKPSAFVIIALGYPERNRRALEASLERLDHLVTTTP